MVDYASPDHFQYQLIVKEKHMRTTSFWRWSSLMLVLMVLLSACGGTAAAPVPTAAPAEAPTAAAAPTAPAAEVPTAAAEAPTAAAEAATAAPAAEAPTAAAAEGNF